MINLDFPLRTYQEVKDVFSKYIHNPEDHEKIYQAYLFACEKHAGQVRKSGQPYIVHVIEVAYILSTLQAGPSTIEAGFLHDTVEDCGVTIDELTERFGPDISKLVEALTKIKQLSKNRSKEFEAEGHRKIFIAMAKDIRVIIIKLADRLHNMRTLQFMTPESQIRIARETLDVYAPIAHRLGINKVKAELENLCLYYLERDKYLEVEGLIGTRTKDLRKAMIALQKKLADMLFKSGIKFEISSRVKEIYSIYKKMYIKKHRFENIYDIMALRIITETELNCYEILGYIHSVYKPIPGRFKDYIAMPKPNMYQSLHTTIIGNDGNIFEIQIRTKEMDEVAESGVAAHWRYKEGTKYDAKKEQKEIVEKLHWFADFVSMSGTQSDDAKEYMQSLQKDIFDANVYVFTPNGKVIDLPSGATPLDFAYKIHTGVGDSAVGALVNGTLVPLSTELKTGDVVEIKTSKNSQGPNVGWLKIVKSNFAKSHIKKFLAKKNAEFVRLDAIEKGKTALAEVFKEVGINEKNMLTHITDRVLKQFNAPTMEDFFYNVANRNPQPIAVLEYLNLRKEDLDEQIETYIKKQAKVAHGDSNQAVIIKGATNVMTVLAACCTPIPGDPIVGYISKGKGIKVHRKECPNIAKEKQRLIEVVWNPNLEATNYPVDIAISSTDRNNLLVDILNQFSQLKTPCQKVNAKIHSSTITVTIDATILVTDAARLQDVFDSIINIDGVYEVKRLTH